MCIFGGFAGGYALLTRMENFGAAQTSNMIELVLCLLGRNWWELLIRLGAFLCYVSAILLTVIIQKKTHFNSHLYVLLIDAVAVLLLAFIPADINPVLGLYPMFFMLATQWSIFHGAKGYTCSTIFSTNNLKQTVLAYTNYYLERKPEEKEKGKFFLSSLLCFHGGVAVSYFGCTYIGVTSILISLLPLFAAFHLVHQEFQLKAFLKNEVSILSSKETLAS